jgi:hypothetical protein
MAAPGPREMAAPGHREISAHGHREMAANGLTVIAPQVRREMSGASSLAGGAGEGEAAAAARDPEDRRARAERQDRTQRHPADHPRRREFAGIEWSSEALA